MRMMDERPYQLNQVAIRMVQEPPLLSRKPMNNPEAAIEVMRDVFRDYDREVVCVVNLKANLQPISLNIASIGTIDRAVAHPRELLKSAVLSNAASVILMHLHPSGDLEPSDLDIVMTDRMQQAFSMLGIGVVDHIIMADRDEYFSFRERQVMPVGEPHYTTELAEIDLKKAYPLQRESVLGQLREAKDIAEGKAQQRSLNAQIRSPDRKPGRQEVL